MSLGNAHVQTRIHNVFTSAPAFPALDAGPNSRTLANFDGKFNPKGDLLENASAQ